jgi:hypothetical protein
MLLISRNKDQEVRILGKLKMDQPGLEDERREERWGEIRSSSESTKAHVIVRKKTLYKVMKCINLQDLGAACYSTMIIC